MRTNIELDEQLLKRAARHLPRATKPKIVDTALREFVEQRERADLRDFFGSQLIAPEYDYKSARRCCTMTATMNASSKSRPS